MSAPRFQIGAAVTVRRGTRDPDFPDIPLGGWTGTVRTQQTAVYEEEEDEGQ